jgi:hypothetical protein
MIIDKKKGKITIYIVEKDFDNNQLQKILNTKLKPSDISFIINEDADVYTKEGKLLLKFRKNVLDKKYIDLFYDNVIKFAELKSNNRGNALGSKKRNVYENKKIKSNIIGFFDTLSIQQKFLLKQQKNKNIISVRPTRFNVDFPEKYEKLLPLVQQIDEYYKKLTPEHYEKQRKKANQTHFKIKNTSFTTITTNVNFQTTIHTDKGDDDEGFGNLSVIEKGKYTGGETCFPQYGIGVNVRLGDILFMDVHEAHGNLPIITENDDAKRLSIVCYLRKKIWEKTKGKSKEFFNNQINLIKNIKSNKNKKSIKNKTRKNK